MELANMSDIKKKLLSKEGKNTFSKNGIISEHKDIMIRACFDKIPVKKIGKENNFSIELENYDDLTNEDEVLVLNLDQTSGADGKYRLIFIKKGDFFKKEREFSTIGVEEALTKVVDHVKSRFNTEDLDIYTVMEEPFIAVVPDLNSITRTQVKVLFKEYMESYVTQIHNIINRVLKDTSGKLTVSSVYGREFEYKVLGEFKVPMWTSTNEDIFSKYKNEIESKLKTADSNVFITGEESEIDIYIDKYDRRLYEIPYRIKFVKSNKILGDFAKWVCVGPTLLRLYNIECLTELVNLIDDQPKTIEFESKDE